MATRLAALDAFAENLVRASRTTCNPAIEVATNIKQMYSSYQGVDPSLHVANTISPPRRAAYARAPAVGLR